LRAVVNSVFWLLISGSFGFAAGFKKVG